MDSKLRDEIVKTLAVQGVTDGYICDKTKAIADSILSLLAPELEKARKWDEVEEIAEHAKTLTVEGTCDKCELLHKCHSLRTRTSSGALLIPCIELYRYIEALTEKEAS